jgi:hypothetical protein
MAVRNGHGTGARTRVGTSLSAKNVLGLKVCPELATLREPTYQPCSSFRVAETRILTRAIFREPLYLQLTLCAAFTSAI